MKNEFLTPSEAASRILAGDVMAIAGSEQALSQLPKGRWIGGTTVYFMTAEQGGVVDHDHLFCTTFAHVANAQPRHLPNDQMHRLTEGYLDNGFTMILIPGFSQALAQFAKESARFPGLYAQPLAGWIAGVHLDDVGRVAPRFFDGSTGQSHDEGVALLHVALPGDRVVDLDIVNIFSPSTQDTREITFPTDGFSATRAVVDGAEVDFADFLRKAGVDTRMPILADYAGAMINVSFHSVHDDHVQFYAPVQPGVVYHLAAPVLDYSSAFDRHSADVAEGLSCNCILNFVHGQLQGRPAGGYVGPITFGEVAYMLLNQTLVKLDIRPA